MASLARIVVLNAQLALRIQDAYLAELDFWMEQNALLHAQMDNMEKLLVNYVNNVTNHAQFALPEIMHHAHHVLKDLH